MTQSSLARPARPVWFPHWAEALAHAGLPEATCHLYRTVLFSFLLSTLCVTGQGTFIYDQQSSDENNYREGGADIQQNQPIGQSFTPALPTVGFIRLIVYNGLLGDTSGATLIVNLRRDSITGPILSSSEPISIPSGSLFAGPVDFFFASPVSVTPGATYYFQPVVQNNNNLGLNQSFYNYSGGTAFFQGTPSSINDLWFREGIVVVPEPSTVSLLVLGVLAFGWRASRNRRRPATITTCRD